MLLACCSCSAHDPGRLLSQGSCTSCEALCMSSAWGCRHAFFAWSHSSIHSLHAFQSVFKWSAMRSQVLSAGGCSEDLAGLTTPATNAAYIFDLATATWTATPTPMTQPRVIGNVILLPTRQVLIINGAGTGVTPFVVYAGKLHVTEHQFKAGTCFWAQQFLCSMPTHADQHLHLRMTPSMLLFTAIFWSSYSGHISFTRLSPTFVM